MRQADPLPEEKARHSFGSINGPANKCMMVNESGYLTKSNWGSNNHPKSSNRIAHVSIHIHTRRNTRSIRPRAVHSNTLASQANVRRRNGFVLSSLASSVRWYVRLCLVAIWLWFCGRAVWMSTFYSSFLARCGG